MSSKRSTMENLTRLTRSQTKANKANNATNNIPTTTKPSVSGYNAYTSGNLLTTVFLRCKQALKQINTKTKTLLSSILINCKKNKIKNKIKNQKLF